MISQYIISNKLLIFCKDEEGLDKDLDDLIDDNPVEEEGEESEGEGEKRKHEDSELEEDLSDEDYDLIEENLGIKVSRKVRHSFN